MRWLREKVKFFLQDQDQDQDHIMNSRERELPFVYSSNEMWMSKGLNRFGNFLT